jgi:hypothetical protein
MTTINMIEVEAGYFLGGDGRLSGDENNRLRELVNDD